VSEDLKNKWNARYRDSTGEAQAAAVLTSNIHLLPRQGSALDLACGLGANALLLAKKGLQTWAWDLSEVAIEKLQAQARDLELPLIAETRDVERHPPEPERFDVIVVTRFLDRSLAPALMDALRPGGLLFYQTWTRTSVDQSGPGNPTYRLEDNELLHMFAPLSLIVYREEARIGDLDKGFRNEAMLVGQKSQ
jgi:tellurite methyltransferase